MIFERQVLDMKIIKEGDNSRLSEIRRFRCKCCGCIFECDKSEYRTIIEYRNETYLTAICPTCGNKTFEKENGYEDGQFFL